MPGRPPTETTSIHSNFPTTSSLSSLCTRLMIVLPLPLSKKSITKRLKFVNLPVAGSGWGPAVFVTLSDSLMFLVTRMRNGIRTNADMGLYNHSSGSATLYPGIVVECGFSDSLKKARRDITLWLDNSDLEVL